MAAPEVDWIEVAYARPDRQRVIRLALAPGLSAIAAVQASGILQEFPELGATRLELGIYGRRAAHEQPLRPGDRVEIYRPLQADPREMRRRRAAGGGRSGPHRSD
ncbi:MAG TPA: RnfH family protein [Steroidobacteraceae bacterium]|nr:RnfH family protein [Steroidobacteraceae bacterium]